MISFSCARDLLQNLTLVRFAHIPSSQRRGMFERQGAIH